MHQVTFPHFWHPAGDAGSSGSIPGPWGAAGSVGARGGGDVSASSCPGPANVLCLQLLTSSTQSCFIKMSTALGLPRNKFPSCFQGRMKPISISSLAGFPLPRGTREPLAPREQAQGAGACGGGLRSPCPGTSPGWPETAPGPERPARTQHRLRLPKHRPGASSAALHGAQQPARPLGAALAPRRLSQPRPRGQSPELTRSTWGQLPSRAAVVQPWGHVFSAGDPPMPGGMNQTWSVSQLQLCRHRCSRARQAHACGSQPVLTGQAEPHGAEQRTQPRETRTSGTHTLAERTKTQECGISTPESSPVFATFHVLVPKELPAPRLLFPGPSNPLRRGLLRRLRATRRWRRLAGAQGLSAAWPRLKQQGRRAG